MSSVEDQLASDAAAWQTSVDSQVRRFTVDSRYYAPRRRFRQAVVVAAAISVAAAAAAGFIGLASGGSGSGPQDTSCVAPTLRVSPPVIRAGGQLTITGHHFFGACHDVQERGQPPHQMPVNVPLQLQPSDGPAVNLADAHPDAAGSFSITVTVPRTTQAGTVTVTDTETHIAAKLRITG